jgi:hypothetical protein
MKAYSQNGCGIQIHEEKILNNENLGFFQKRLINDSFDTYYNKTGIPEYIRAKLYCLVGPMANPGENWQSTDNVIDESLPWKRLVFCSLNRQKDIFIVVYEHGGEGKNTKIIMMKLTDKGVIVNHQKNVEDIWIGQTFFNGNTIAELADFIKKNKVPNKLNTNAVGY